MPSGFLARNFCPLSQGAKRLECVKLASAFRTGSQAQMEAEALACRIGVLEEGLCCAFATGDLPARGDTRPTSAPAK